MGLVTLPLQLKRVPYLLDTVQTIRTVTMARQQPILELMNCATPSTTTVTVRLMKAFLWMR